MNWKLQINLETNILQANGTGKSSTLAWHHNFWDVMLGTGCSLEISEMALTICKNPEETEEFIISGSSNNASTSNV